MRKRMMIEMRAWVASLHFVTDHYHYYHYSHCSIERFVVMTVLVHDVGDDDYCESVDDGEQCSDGSIWPCHVLVPVHAHMMMTVMMMKRHRAVW